MGPKLQILQNVGNVKGHNPCTTLTKNFRFYRQLYEHINLATFFQWVPKLWRFNLQRGTFLKIFSAPSDLVMVKLFIGSERVGKVKMVRISSIIMVSVVGLGLHILSGKNFNVHISFCLPVMLLKDISCQQ